MKIHLETFHVLFNNLDQVLKIYKPVLYASTSFSSFFFFNKKLQKFCACCAKDCRVLSFSSGAGFLLLANCQMSEHCATSASSVCPASCVLLLCELMDL